MARNISDIVDFVQYLVRKERGVFITPAQTCDNLDAAQLNILEDYFKMYGQNQMLHDAIKPFRVYTQFTTDASGFITYPSDYLHLIGSPFSVNGSTINEITLCNEDEWVTALKSQLRPVSLSRPLGKDTSTGISLYPQTTQIGFLTYIKRPAVPVYGYTQAGRVITYDPNTSVQLEWNDAFINAIIGQSLSFVGINMDEPTVSQFAQNFKQESE